MGYQVPSPYGGAGHAIRLTAGAIFVALLGGVAALAPSAAAESSPSAFGSRLVTLINQARAQHGLRALTVAPGTSTVAANWTSHMAAAQGLSHNPSLGSQLESHGSPNWTTYAENVAFGDPSSADAMFTNYMNSAEHRANILDSHFRYIGVGVVFSGGDALERPRLRRPIRRDLDFGVVPSRRTRPRPQRPPPSSQIR